MDSDNVLSILASLGAGQQPPVAAPGDEPYSGAPANVLQSLAPQALPVTGPSIPQATAALPDASVPDQLPRKRRSVLETIGQLGDLFAKVGGAEAMYQPTLDAREDRSLALGDHARKVQADEIALATGKFDLNDKETTRLGQTARGLKAIQAKGGDITQAWPILAQRMNLAPQTIESVGQALASDPNALDGLIAATTDPKYAQSKFSGSVVYATGPDGKVVAFQPSLDESTGRNILPDGYTAIEPSKVLDLGGSAAVVGNSGQPKRILPKTAKPDTVLTTNTSRGNNIRDNDTKIKIAGMPARAQAGKGGADPAMIETAQGNLDELRSIYADLHNMGAMVSPAQSTNKNVIARIRSSGIGQTLEGAAGTKAQEKRDRIASIRPGLMQSLAKATGMTGKQLDSNADVKLFMQTVTDPTKAYEANIKAIDGLERFLKANAKKNAAQPATPAAPRPKAKAGWTLVEVK